MGHALSASELDLVKGGTKGSSEGAYLEYITQGADKDARIHQMACCVKKGQSDTEEDAEQVSGYECIKVDQVPSKPRTLKGLCHIHAVSADGSVIFGGAEELIVYR
jgi:hypothetical protein